MRRPPPEVRAARSMVAAAERGEGRGEKGRTRLEEGFRNGLGV